MSAAGGGPAQATPQPVLEIYTQNGLEPYFMKPVGNGTDMFQSQSESIYKVPDLGDRVKLHSDLIAYGVLHPVLGDPGDKLGEQFWSEMPCDRSYTMPHLNNPHFQFIMVFDNHKYLEQLKTAYAKSAVAVDQNKADDYCKGIGKRTYAQSEANIQGGQPWVTPPKRHHLSMISVAVDRRVKRIMKAAADAAAEAAADEINKELSDEKTDPIAFEPGNDAADVAEAHSAAAVLGGEAAGQGGGSRRPSRKYKKSRRVLRRKSRATRRR
jgi:hypothetical protein